MIEYTIEDEFEATVDDYWSMFFSKAFNDALWPHIDVEYELLDYREEQDGDVIHRRQRLTPKREVPRALQRLVKGAISYEEANVWRKADSAMSVVVTPSFMSSSFDSTGTYTVKPAGEGKVLRRWTSKVICKVPMVGGSVEKTVVDSVKESYRRTTQFTREWIAEHRV